MKKPIIFTDLDGTLLDYATYSFEAALPALTMLKEEGIPLVICSSKTRREIEYYRQKLDNHSPFISENGGGIFVPDGYFGFFGEHPPGEVNGAGGYHIIRLGARYDDLRAALKSLRGEGFAVRGFGDMTGEEVASLTGMGIAVAGMAKERDFDEPFIFSGDEAAVTALFKAIRSRGFTYTKGRFYHLLGNSDKGRAVTLLIDLFRKHFDDVVTIAIGDSQNDVPMLGCVDHSIIVQQPEGGYEPGISLPRLIRAPGIGPAGWNTAILELLTDPAFGIATGEKT